LVGNPRFALYDGSVITMFPRRMMNTAVSASLLSGSQYARFIENILPNTLKAGSGAKRFGLTTKGNAIVGGNIIDTMEYRTSSGSIEFLVYVDDGSIRRLNEGTGAYTSLITGLVANGNPRWVAFNEKLIIADGVNPLMAYNGSTLASIKEWVIDYDGPGTGGLATAAVQVDTNTITVTVGAGRSDYAIGKRIRVTFATAGAVVATINGVSGSGTLTVDVSGTPFPNPSQTINIVEYEATAPAFSDIYVEHQRLWALSAGETKATTFRGITDGMKVYYTDATNNEASWYNEATQEVGFINLLNRARRFDELVRISSIDGYMVFFGRLNTFLFAGDDPTILGEFVWQKTLPVGCINGNLVQKYPGDVLFFTRYGARSLRTVFQTEGQEVVPDLGTDVDPTVTAFVDVMVRNNALYRGARSFFYERDGFYGYSFGGQYVMIYSLSEESKGWSFFSGYFSTAKAFLGTSDGRLMIAVGGQLYSYANGTDGQITYSDNGVPIKMRWWTPWLKPKSGRWSNIGYELMVEDALTTVVSVYRAVDEREDSVTTTPIEIDFAEGSAYWDEAYWDEAYWDSAKRRGVVRDKFLADSFYLILQNESTAGPISLLGIKPIGK
jgi:hypothetical protein